MYATIPVSARNQRERAMSTQPQLTDNPVGRPAWTDGFTLEDAHLTMLLLEKDHPAWFAAHENNLVDPLLCERKDLLDALASAPNPFIAGMIYNALVMRTQMAAFSGRPDL